MKIALDSLSARTLAVHGVKPRELQAANILVFDFQLGGAITLPFPVLGPVILIKSRWLRYDGDGELEDAATLKVVRHELCHVVQILDWGGLAYLVRHVMARIRSRNLFAKDQPEEKCCYRAGQRVEDHYSAGPHG
jgi:hypothetical protein